MQVAEGERALQYLQQIARKPVKPAGDWEVCLWFPGEGQPNNDELMDELGKCVEMQIDELEERLR